MHNHWGKTLGAFLLALLPMPLGHALMILMEHFLDGTALHLSAFLMGLAGFAIVIRGVYVKGDTRQTLYGLAGGLLLWTGWIEFLIGYYAARYGTQFDLTGSGSIMTVTTYVDGIGAQPQTFIASPDLTADMLRAGADLSGSAALPPAPAGADALQAASPTWVNVDDIDPRAFKALRGSRPEYLTMPGTFGFFMLFMLLYLFCTRTGCNFLVWIQDKCGIAQSIDLRPMARHTSIVTCLELNVMMWACYLLLMFCYDPVMLGQTHPVTLAVAVVCLVGSGFMFARQLKIAAWGANIRMAIATVIVFWTFVEVAARDGFFSEFWVEPLAHVAEIVTMLVALIAVAIFIYRQR